MGMIRNNAILECGDSWPFRGLAHFVVSALCYAGWLKREFEKKTVPPVWETVMKHRTPQCESPENHLASINSKALRAVTFTMRHGSLGDVSY